MTKNMSWCRGHDGQVAWLASHTSDFRVETVVAQLVPNTSEKRSIMFDNIRELAPAAMTNREATTWNGILRPKGELQSSR